MCLAMRGRNCLNGHVSGILRSLLAARLGLKVAAEARNLVCKRLAARESPEAMEPPTVSRFLYRKPL